LPLFTLKKVILRRRQKEEEELWKLKYFTNSQNYNLQNSQNYITFVCLLSACSHAGLVDEGMRCYASMIKDYTISATLEHFMQHKTHLINLTETSLFLVALHCIACNKMCIS